MEVAQLVLEYLAVLLSWPVATAAIAFVFFKTFKGPLADFFRRMVRGEAYGVRLEAASPAEQVQEAEQIKALPEQGQIEKWIAENPKLVLEEYQRAVNGYLFERAYNLIYGTQIQLLDHLEKKGEEGEKYVNLLPYYNDFRQRSGWNTQFADYLNFLRTSNFVEVVGDGSDVALRITPWGVDFLSYIKTQYPGTYHIKAF